MVSIIIPTYNAEKYIKSCIDSIFAQSYKDFEVIIVDDKSIDNTSEVLKNIQSKYVETNQLQVLFLESNVGVSEARNIGLRYAIGDYVWFIDADDFVMSDALENMTNIAKMTDAMIVMVKLGSFLGNMDIKDVGREKSATPVWYCPTDYEKRWAMVTEAHLLPKHKTSDALLSAVAGSLYKRESIQNTNFRKGLVSGEDKLFIQDVIYKELLDRDYAVEIAIIDEPLYWVRRDSSCNTNQRVETKLRAQNGNIVCCNWLKILKIIEPLDDNMAYRKLQSLKNVIKSSLRGGGELRKSYLLDSIITFSNAYNDSSAIAKKNFNIKERIMNSIVALLGQTVKI